MMQVSRFFVLLLPECTHIKCSSYVPFKHREFMSSCSWPKDTSPINFVQPLTFSICKSSCKKSREQIRENITNLDCQHSPRAVERANEHTIFYSSHSSLRDSLLGFCSKWIDVKKTVEFGIQLSAKNSANIFYPLKYFIQ